MMTLASLCWACTLPPVPPQTAEIVSPVDISSNSAAVSAAHAAMLRKFPAYDDAALQAYVQSVGDRLLAQAPRTSLPISFNVLDTPGIFAYSFGSGEIVISRGLIIHLNTEAQLAAVLGHEIGHIVSRHQILGLREYENTRALAERLSKRFSTNQAQDALNTLGFAKVRGYNREQELEADAWSERLLSRSAYPASAMAQTLRFFVQEAQFSEDISIGTWDLPESGDEINFGIFSTHPSLPARLEQAGKRLGTGAAQEALPDTRYINALDGVLAGLPVRAGTLRGNAYMNPVWDVGLLIEAGWSMFNQGEDIYASPRSGDALLRIRISDQKSGSASSVLQAMAGSSVLRNEQKISSALANGMTGTVQTRDGSRLRIGVVDLGAKRLSFVGQAYADDGFAAVDPGFVAMIRSAHILSAAERRMAAPIRMHVLQPELPGPLTAEAMTLDPLIVADHPRERWRLLNQLYPDKAPVAGSALKTMR
ncbi:M48 family metalloprotease [Uliginosibacterium sp. H3]|uniref:M48 family metalloprotease n=1 Tax=Uliginosibacterium silvisoli TaxID=3114758 RepID=A0ABU6K4T9_9RHOO|nr:M48 family metalloprotease [Uliginosibacterium sp. H3]